MRRFRQTGHATPKHLAHFVCLPEAAFLPKAAFLAGDSGDPHVQKLQTDTVLGGLTKWILFRWVFSTATVGTDDDDDATSFPEACVPDEVETTAQPVKTMPSASLRFGERATVVPQGVPGTFATASAGVAGNGKHPSFVGRHPDRRWSAIVFRVISSVTHASASYRSGIFEPFSQWPSRSRASLVRIP